MNRHRVVLCGAPEPWWTSVIISLEATSLFFISRIVAVQELKDSVLEIQPAVLLWKLEGMEQIQLIEEINHECPFTLIVVMVADPRSFDLLKLVHAGIKGCLPLHTLPQHIVKAVELITLSGMTCLPRLAPDALYPGSHFASNGLTLREREVLSLLKKNYSNREIAISLFISESTVKSHLSNAFKKMGARNRSEALSLMMSGSNSF